MIRKKLMALCLSLVFVLALGSISVFAQDAPENTEDYVFSAVVDGNDETVGIAPMLDATWWTPAFETGWTTLGYDNNLKRERVTVTLLNLSAVNAGEDIPKSVKIAIFKEDGTQIANTITLKTAGDSGVIGTIPAFSGKWYLMAQVEGAPRGSVTVSVKD